MPFQGQVREFMAYGIPGEFQYDSPSRVQPGTIDPANAAAQTAIARYYSKNQETGLYTSTGNPLEDEDLIFGGILGFPKEKVLLSAQYAPSMLVVPGSADNQFVEMGMINVLINNVCLEGYVAAAEIGTGRIFAYANAEAVPETHFLIPNTVVYRTENSNPAGAVVTLKLTN